MLKFLRLSLIVFLSSSFCQTFAQDSLILDLPFSNEAMDESSYRNHGKVFGAVLTDDRFGNPNSAYYFDGENDYIEVQDAESLNPSTITMSAWVKVDLTDSHTPDILRKSTYDNATDEQYFLRVAFDEYPQAGVKANATCAYSPNAWTRVQSEDTITLNQWHFLAATFDSLSLKIYLDGKLVNEEVLVTAKPIISCGGNLRIGMAWSTYPNYFKGVIDDIKVFNKALDACAIQTLFHENSGDLVAYYPFNGNAHDESSYGNDGTVKGPVLTEDRFGNPYSAYLFDGVDDFIEVQDDASLNPANITLAAWVKPELIGSKTPDIIRKSTYEDATDEQYFLRIAFDEYPQTGVKANTTCDYSPNAWKVNLSDEPIMMSKWHFLVATFDSVSLKLYVDGYLVNEEMLENPEAIIACGGNLRIGMAWRTYPHYFKGVIDDIRIYNRALDDCEIQSLFNDFKNTDVITAVTEESETEHSIIIYPNPVTGNYLHLEAENLQNQKYEIAGMDGRKIDNGKVKGKINVSRLKTGTYILSIYDSERNLILSERFIKM